MPEEKQEQPEKYIVAVISQEYMGGTPTIIRGIIGFPNESMGQLAARAELDMEKWVRSQYGAALASYTFTVMLGELTHQIAPPPPPKAKELVPVQVKSNLTGRAPKKKLPAVKKA